MDDSTFYALPEGSRGIFVDGGASVRVPKLIGAHRMMDMMLTGRVYQGEDCVALGFAQYFEQRGAGGTGALDKAIELATRIAQNEPMTCCEFEIRPIIARLLRWL